MATNQITSEEKLQEHYEALLASVDRRRAALAKVNRGLEQLANDLTDCPEDKHAELVAERRDLAAERDAIQDVLRVLERRRDITHLAIYELRLSAAIAEARRMEELVLRHRQTLDAALTDRRHFLNGGRGMMPAAEGDKKSIELKKLIAGLTAEGQLLVRDAGKAGVARDRAAAELEALRRDLGVLEANQAL